MQPITRSYSPSGSNEPANRDSALHPSTTASSGDRTLSISEDNNTISSMSASSVQAENSLGSVYSDIGTSSDMTDGVQSGNSNAQPDARTAQLNYEPESQHPSEETFMMSDHESSTDGNTQKRSWKYKLKKAARGWWLWEIGGAGLSIGCMVAILIIIPYIHNQPLKNWRFMITPNTMISTLITVSKTSMLLAVAAGMGQLKWQHFHRNTSPISELDIYDEASRGPWGALVFILVSPFRSRDTIAILGAFVTLSSLTMEPLAQQLLLFQTRNILQDNGSAWISMATSYGADLSEFEPILDLHARSLIMQGILGSPPPLSSSCSSSNCSWSDFHTIGICSSCSNITSDCPVKKYVSDERLYVEWSYTTPKGMTLKVTFPPDSGLPSGNTLSGNITDRDLMGIMDIAVVAIANASHPKKIGESFPGHVYGQTDITECRISWCARFYSNLKMTNGILNPYTMEEKIFSSEEIRGPPDRVRNVTQSGCRYIADGTVTFRAAHGGTSYQFLLGCNKIWAISRYLEDLFEFQVYEDEISLASGGLIINAESVPAAMDAITNSFSVYMMTSTSDTTRHYGKAFSPEIFVIIRWQWLIFPGLLTILGACFLGTSLWTSRAYRTSFHWKDSLIPLLFHGLSGWEKGEMHAKDKMEMDERAKRMKAKLKKDGEGSLKFIRA